MPQQDQILKKAPPKASMLHPTRWILQQDSASSHRSASTQHFLCVEELASIIKDEFKSLDELIHVYQMQCRSGGSLFNSFIYEGTTFNICYKMYETFKTIDPCDEVSS